MQSQNYNLLKGLCLCRPLSFSCILSPTVVLAFLRTTSSCIDDITMFAAQNLTLLNKSQEAGNETSSVEESEPYLRLVSFISIASYQIRSLLDEFIYEVVRFSRFVHEMKRFQGFLPRMFFSSKLTYWAWFIVIFNVFLEELSVKIMVLLF